MANNISEINNIMEYFRAIYEEFMNHGTYAEVWQNGVRHMFPYISSQDREELMNMWRTCHKKMMPR